MTPPKQITDPRDTELPSAASQADGPSDAFQPAPGAVFDPDLFQDLHDFLGDAQMRASLMELADSLQAGFPDILAEPADRDQIFQHAHTLGARAGMMGFVGLRNACWQLQHACSTGTPIGPDYASTQAMAGATRAAIAVLHQRLA